MHVLLIEPDYYTRYPPLGLLKLSTYHKQKGDSTELVRGTQYPRRKPDRIYVTSLFTWAWKPVWECVRYYKIQFPKTEVWLGGIYASLLPDHAKMSGADKVQVGIYPAAEDCLPDYDLVPDWDATILFASRGCIRRCGFCSVPKIEGGLKPKRTIKDLIDPRHKRIVLFDNDILGSPNWPQIFDELAETGLPVDFNQGLDARLITDEAAEKIAKLKMHAIRLAFDYSGIRKFVERAITTLEAHGVKRRKLIFYALYNYIDDPNDFFLRVRDLLKWGVVVYPMKFEPLTTLLKGTYVAPKWDRTRLNMVMSARRVIGYAGAFPPYEGLVKKFEAASNFDEAFELRLRKTGSSRVKEKARSVDDQGQLKLDQHFPMQTLSEMALEHQIVVEPRAYFPKWRREKDWRKI
jgi:hypothetical protein